MQWSEKALRTCIEALKESQTVQEAAKKARDRLDANFSVSAMRSAFRRNDYPSPSCFLEDEFMDVDESDRQEENPDVYDRLKKEFYDGLDLDPEDVDDEPVGLTEHEEKKHDLGNCWWVHLKTGSYKVPKDIHRKLKRLYSNAYGLGDSNTINEICRITGWQRKDFHEYKRIFGWTHDSGPHTAEERKEAHKDPEKMKGAKRDIANIVDRELEQFGRNYEFQKVKRLASKYLKLKRGEFDPFKEWISENSPRDEVEFISLDDKYSKRYCVQAAHRDVHLGLLSNTDEVPTEKALVESADLLIRHIKSRQIGNPEVVYFPVGSDFLHIDDERGTTTNGTEMEYKDLPPDLKYKAVDIAIELIDRWRKITEEVCLFLEAGNHDKGSDEWLLLALRSEYRKCDDVRIKLNFDKRQYEKFGKNMFMTTHGDATSISKVPNLMANEAPRMWGQTRWRYCLHGHGHSIEELENGAHVIQCPALSEESSWMKDTGKVFGTRAQAAYLFDYEGGHFAREMVKIGDRRRKNQDI